MWAPVRLVRGGWPPKVENLLQRFVWSDPRAVLDSGVSPEAFRDAMKAFYFGGTFKITGSSRHPLGDSLLEEHVDVSAARIVDIGASDGSTSRDLVLRLGAFGSFTIADRYLTTTLRRTRHHVLFFDGDDRCVLVVGTRLLAWPSMSPRVAALYAPLVRRARRADAGRQVVLLNPTVQALLREDPRVGYTEHDIFTPWPGPAPDVVKVANLLRLLYFPEDRIAAGLRAVLSSLAPGGHFLLVDNPRIEGIAERSGLYRREGDRFVVVAETPHVPEISELITSVRLHDRVEPGVPG